VDFQDLDYLFREGLRLNMDQHQLDKFNLTILNAALITRVGVQSVTASDVERIQHIYDAIKDSKILNDLQNEIARKRNHTGGL